MTIRKTAAAAAFLALAATGCEAGIDMRVVAGDGFTGRAAGPIVEHVPEIPSKGFEDKGGWVGVETGEGGEVIGSKTVILEGKVVLPSAED